MTLSILDKRQNEIIGKIPAIHDSTKFFLFVANSSQDADYVSILNKLFSLNDNLLADWLNISSRTFRNYRKNPDLSLKENTKEHILILLSLYKHGIETFGNKDDFEKWLSLPNILLDNKPPVSFLDTILGIKFIDNRLIAMEFGENV